MSDDALFVTTRAKTKSVKHLCMELPLEKVLNRFGHCISYHTPEALETELTTDIILEASVPATSTFGGQNGECRDIQFTNKTCIPPQRTHIGTVSQET